MTLSRIRPGPTFSAMLSLFTIFLAPLFVKSMDLTESQPNSSDHFFSQFPQELVSENILKYAIPSSLLVLSMTSKEFYELSEKELNARCSRDYCDIIGENGCHIKGDDENLCRTKSFLCRAWPKSELAQVSSKLEWTLKLILDSLEGIECKIDWEPYQRIDDPLLWSPFEHPQGFPEVTITYLKLKLSRPVSIDKAMFAEVPWQHISNYAEGGGGFYNLTSLTWIISSLLSDGHYDVIEAMIADEKTRTLFEPEFPFSCKFLESLVATRSVEKTVKMFNLKDELRRHHGTGRRNHDEFFLRAGLSVELLVEMFNNYWYRFDGLTIVGDLLKFGYQPELAWFDNPKFFKQEQMDEIMECFRNNNWSQLDIESLKVAIVYALVKGTENGDSVDEKESLVNSIIGDRDFNPGWPFDPIFQYFQIRFPF